MALWAIAPKGQSDPKAGSEASMPTGREAGDDRTTGRGLMLELLFQLLSAGATAAIATVLWWMIQEKRNDHDGQDRDR